MKGTDEDDDLEIEQLLAEQDRFLQSRQKASAKVVRVQPPTTDAKPAPSMPSTPIPEIERDVVQLSNVFERDPSLPIQPPKPRSRPFPEVVQLSMEEMRSREQAKKENKKSSLFTKMRQENPSQPPMGSAPIGNIPPPPPVKATLREVSTWRFDFGGRIVTEGSNAMVSISSFRCSHAHGSPPSWGATNVCGILLTRDHYSGSEFRSFSENHHAPVPQCSHHQVALHSRLWCRTQPPLGISPSAPLPSSPQSSHRRRVSLCSHGSTPLNPHPPHRRQG